MKQASRIAFWRGTNSRAIVTRGPLEVKVHSSGFAGYYTRRTVGANLKSYTEGRPAVSRGKVFVTAVDAFEALFRQQRFKIPRGGERCACRMTVNSIN